MRFKDLPIGSRFIFTSERDHPHWGLAKGPWVKTSARKYRHATDSGLANCKVGTVAVEVVRID